MSNVARVRVELKRKYNDPDKNFKEMLHEFKKRVNLSGVLHDYKEHQYFESKSEKDRKKRNDAIKKFKMEAIEAKILAGEKVDAPAGIIKKVMANLNKDKKKDKKNQYEE